MNKMKLIRRKKKDECPECYLKRKYKGMSTSNKAFYVLIKQQEQKIGELEYYVDRLIENEKKRIRVV